MSEEYYIGEGEDLVTKFEYLRHIPGYIGVKDINSIFQSCSNDFAKVCGWKSLDNVIGKTDYEVPCEASKAAELFINVDRKVIKHMRSITSIEICYYTTGLIAFLDHKIPIKNDQDTVLGVFCNAIDITAAFIKSYQWLDQTDPKFTGKVDIPRQYILTSEASFLPLSNRQQECLSLLVRGKTMKEIAYILGISVRTVETHFETIKHKLGCYNKSQLIEKAIDSGFLFHIPGSLFGLNLFK
jgi:DNA-binding CsgD family transcriptional regulator